MGIVGVLDWVHDEVACLYQSAEEDESLGAAEGSEVATSLAEHLASELENLIGYLVALAGGNAYVERGDVLGVELAQQ